MSSSILEASESEEEVKEVGNAGAEECSEAVKDDEVGEETMRILNFHRILVPNGSFPTTSFEQVSCFCIFCRFLFIFIWFHF